MKFARSFARVLWLLVLVAGVVAVNSPCLAASPGDEPAAASAAALPACSTADNVWVLVSAALVLMMTAPGLRFSIAAWSARRTC